MSNYTIRLPDGRSMPLSRLVLGDFRRRFTVTGDMHIRGNDWLPTTVTGRLESVEDFADPRKPYSLLGLINNGTLIKIRLLKAVA